MYSMLPTNVRSLPLEVEPNAFAEEWLSCIDNEKSDLTKLIHMMQPVFSDWSERLRGMKDKKEINYITLCRLLSKNPAEALSMIDSYTKYIAGLSSVEEDLCLLFIERTRNIKYKPTLAKPGMVEYIVARDFKMGLHHRIRSVCRLLKRDALYYANENLDDVKILINIYKPDILLYKNLELSKWRSYLFHLIQQGYTTIERAELTNVHRRNLYNEENNLWQSLRPMLLIS